MGKVIPWYSVITNLPRTAHINDELKDKFDAFGKDWVHTILTAMQAATVDQEWAVWTATEPSSGPIGLSTTKTLQQKLKLQS